MRFYSLFFREPLVQSGLKVRFGEKDSVVGIIGLEIFLLARKYCLICILFSTDHGFRSRVLSI
jgi:hypothetical protein